MKYMPILTRIITYLVIVIIFLHNSLFALAQTVGVTAQVTPHASDIEIDIGSPSGNGPFYQGAEIQYEITYSQTTSSAHGFSIEANWSLGQFQSGVNNPSVEVLEYVIGSASDAYNNTAPIINPTNRTITWSIPSLPANTEGVVSFRLRTTSNFTGQDRATFNVRSVATVISTVVSDTLTQTYQYNYDPDAYVKSLTPAPTNPPTPTPTPPPNLEFEYIIIPEIRSDTARIEVKTNIHTKSTIRYGTSPQNLNTTFFSNSPALYHFFTLDELTPETEYYFQLEVSDAYRTRTAITSDIFTFRTATVSDIPQINEASIIFTSSNTILFDGFTTDEDNLKNRIITLPTLTPFEFRFALADGESVKSVVSIVRESTQAQNPVLGISLSPQTVPGANFAQIVEVERGVYMGRLLSLTSPGLTDVLVRVTDFEGNVIEYKIGTIKTVNPMRIINGKSGKGLENARVELELYNPTQKMFQPISPEVIPIPNPSFSSPEGFIHMVLPHGTYRATISLVRFTDKTVEFTIGPYDTIGYPTVELEPQPFAVTTTAKYYLGIILDLESFFNAATVVLSESFRAYDLLNALALLILLSTIVLLLAQTLWNLYDHILYPFLKRAQNNHSSFIQVIVANTANHQRIRHAHVFLVDLAKDKIIARTRSNVFGYATFHIPQPKKFRITALHKGYESQAFYDFKAGGLVGTQTVWLKEYKSNKHPMRVLLKNISLFLYEILLLILILLEILFTQKYGVRAMLPFYLLLGLTLFLYIIHWVIGKRK